MIGNWILLGWAAVYSAIVFVAIIARRSWIDLLMVFIFLLLLATLLNLAHPLLGSTVLTVLPAVLVLLGVARRNR